MLIRNILFLIILAISPYQAYGMNKRPADELLEQDVTKKQNCNMLDGNFQLAEIQRIVFDDIKKSIYNCNPNDLATLIFSKHACQLNDEQKNSLHNIAKEFKNQIVHIEKFTFTHNILPQIENKAVKAKFAFTIERKNLQKISRNLLALKTLQSLEFPQFIFTPIPLCDYNKSVKESDIRIKPDQCVTALIKNEQKGICLCCFHITLESTARALIKKKEEGISVEVITNQEQGSEGNQAIQLLIDNGISVLSPQRKFEQMHHKFCLFDCNIGDKSLLWTGSYNLTAHSNSHSWEDVNILDYVAMIKQYRARFEEIKSNSNPYVIPAIQPQQEPTKAQIAQPQQQPTKAPQQAQPQTNTLPAPKPLTQNNSNHTPQPQQQVPNGSIPQAQQPNPQLNPAQRTVPLLQNNAAPTK